MAKQCTYLYIIKAFNIFNTSQQDVQACAVGKYRLKVQAKLKANEISGYYLQYSSYRAILALLLSTQCILKEKLCSILYQLSFMLGNMHLSLARLQGQEKSTATHPVAEHLQTFTELPYPKAYCTPIAEGFTVVGVQLCPAASEGSKSDASMENDILLRS